VGNAEEREEGAATGGGADAVEAGRLPPESPASFPAVPQAPATNAKANAGPIISDLSTLCIATFRCTTARLLCRNGWQFQVALRESHRAVPKVIAIVAMGLGKTRPWTNGWEDTRAGLVKPVVGGVRMTATVRDVMTTRVIAVRTDASFKEMAAMLRSSRISAFPVVDDSGRVIGVVSEADLLVKEAIQADGVSILAALRHWREDDAAAGITAGDLMTQPAVTIGPDAPVAEAARLMYDRRVKRLPVVTNAGHLVGIISRVDVLSVFERPDEQIRREIVGTVLPGVPGAITAKYKVIVHDGIVTLSGSMTSERDAKLAVEAVRHVEGVVAVRDRFRYPDDCS
jgi:CBS domain-containing protein